MMLKRYEHKHASLDTVGPSSSVVMPSGNDGLKPSTFNKYCTQVQF